MDKDNNIIANSDDTAAAAGARKSQGSRWRRRRQPAAAEAAAEIGAAELSSPVDVIKNLARDAKKTLSAPRLGLAAEVQPLDDAPAEPKPPKRAPRRDNETAVKNERRTKSGRSKDAANAAKEAAAEKPAAKSKTRTAKDTDKKERQEQARHKLSIIPLGGLGEVGKNMTAFRYGNDIIVIDAGMTFPDEELLGVDLVIPDYNYLMENRNLVRGIFVTHGHEDHIGALPYVLKDLKVPVYGSRLTMGLLRGKLKEHNLGNAQLNDVVAGDTITVGPFKVEFIHVSHSIPDSMALAIHTPVGVCLHTGDFKIDMSPIDGQFMDLTRMSELGQEGVLLMMADSTNVEKEGFTPSEKSVGQALDSIFLNATGRIIVTTFASNVHRIQQTIWAAERTGRKVALVGRSMNNVVTVSRELGYLKAKANTFIDITDINKYPDRKVTVLTTGSQGETLAGLTRMSQGEHRQVHLRKGDLVVVSAYPIPGNEK
ncbi:MAG: ribonuclease J, partial [Firmicutes bacterium]|nr:ribonuclease J [Bacillota bacterium]